MTNESIPEYFLKPIPVEGVVEQALVILSKYPNLKLTLDVTNLSNKVKKKYGPVFRFPQGPFDILTALLMSDVELGNQYGKQQMTPGGAIAAIDNLLSTYQTSDYEKKVISDKFCNLGMSKFWDVVSELFVLKTLYENIDHSKYVLEIERPLGPVIKGNGCKNSDFALINKYDGSGIFIDVYTPYVAFEPTSLGDSGLVMATFGQGHGDVLRWLENKYKNKYSTFCLSNPDAVVAVFVSVIKCEEIIASFPRRLVTESAQKVISPVFTGKPGFKYGFVFTLRAPDFKNLILIPVAEFTPGSI